MTMFRTMLQIINQLSTMKVFRRNVNIFVEQSVPFQEFCTKLHLVTATKNKPLVGTYLEIYSKDPPSYHQKQIFGNDNFDWWIYAWRGISPPKITRIYRVCEVQGIYICLPCAC